MDRRHFLAAELFAYSFANYQGHLEVGNLRFTRHMPAEVEILERAEAEEWPDEMIASKLNVPVGEIPDLRVRFAQAKAVVDAPSPAEAFRRGVRQSIRDAVDNGLDSADAIEGLVVQICYRAADLSLLLDREGRTLSEYSAALRAEPDIDWNGEAGGDGS